MQPPDHTTLVDLITTSAPDVVPHPREELFSVLLVHDDPLLRDAMSVRLSHMGAGTVRGAASLAEVRARARISGPCDLVVLGLPGDTGIGLVEEFSALGWPRIVVLGSADDPAAVVTALKAGARGYLWKSAVVNENRVVPTVSPDADDPMSQLSPREVGVLQLVADGHSNKEIGVALSLSALTVKSHLSRIARKLGTGDRAELVALAMRAGVID
ncbi:response regulator transcription factor [Lentzea tibetensis]|uniref:Response regulator transcription factor n=1 Tax=Lentzea tibetensis TaxID=2591470 RepID=A0A563EIL8_9PSEU|nr:response regulator transcription factor [Lentzea tibetensis]TWP45764.1 response regulator transcription factor [Lentzea tibetensis]